MYTLKVRDHFDAAHFLPWHEGKCKNLHGHRWEVEVAIGAKELGPNGIVIDFGIVKQILRDVLPDHKNLNDLMDNPTAENLARTLYSDIRLKLLDAALDDKFDGKDIVLLEEVTVWESPNCSVTYRPDPDPPLPPSYGEGWHYFPLEKGGTTFHMASKGDWDKEIVGGCDKIWTDFGTPMCGVRGSICFIMNPKALCPLKKKLRREGIDAGSEIL